MNPKPCHSGFVRYTLAETGKRKKLGKEMVLDTRLARPGQYDVQTVHVQEDGRWLSSFSLYLLPISHRASTYRHHYAVPSLQFLHVAAASLG
jgi:hypothetical protein